MAPNINAKFEKELIFCFKNGQNLVKFDLSTHTPKLTLSFTPLVQSI